MARPPLARSAGRTHVGHKRRNNEDAHFRDDALGLYVVADGMGGRAAGEVASAEAIDQIVGMIRRDAELLEAVDADPADEERREAVHRLLNSAVQAATYMVYGMAEEQPEQAGMGTTISVLLVTHGWAFIGQVGDSRVYRLRGGSIEQITEDHTLVNEQIKQGLLAPEQAATFRRRNVITRAVGTHDWVEVDTFELILVPGDRFLLSSDGLHDYVWTPEMIVPMLRAPALDHACAQLVELALGKGGKDNVTAVVIEYTAGGTE